MNKTVDIKHAKTHLVCLIAEAEAGSEVVIARAGEPVAKLVPVKNVRKIRRDRHAGFLKGKIRLGPDFDAPLPEEILSAFRGERD